MNKILSSHIYKPEEVEKNNGSAKQEIIEEISVSPSSREPSSEAE